MQPDRSAARPGGHFCCVYRDGDERDRILARFVGLGLERGETVLHLAGPDPDGGFDAALSRHGLDAEAARREGGMVTVRCPSATADAADVVALLRALRRATAEALDRGVPSVRLVADMSRLCGAGVDSGTVRAYETLIHDYLCDGTATVLCQYGLKTLAADGLLALLNTHPAVVIDGRVHAGHGPAAPGASDHGTQGGLEQLLCAGPPDRQERAGPDTVAPSAWDGPDLLSAALEQAPVGLFLTDLEGRCRYTSAKWREIAGLSPEESLGTGWSRGLHPEDREVIASSWTETAARGADWSGDYRFVDADGGTRWVQSTAVPLRGPDGEAVGYVGANVDVTERRTIRQELLDSRRLAWALLNATDQTAVLIDPGLRVVAANDVAAVRVNATAEELLGTDVLSWLDPDVARQRRVFIEQALSGGEPVRFEDARAGRHYATLLQPLRDPDGEVAALAIFATDVTEARRAALEAQLICRALRLLERPGSRREALREFLEAVQSFTGVEAAGLRLRDGEDFTYYETRGMPPGFLERENSLLCRDAQGGPVRDEAGQVFLECMCGNVLQGRTDPSYPFFTENGSFWTNSTTRLLATTGDEDRQAHTRNYCNTVGYESMALVGLRTPTEVLGLLHVVDHRAGLLCPETIASLERIAEAVAVALARRLAEEALAQREERYRSLYESLPGGVLIVGERPEDGEANQSALDILGLPLAELFGGGPEGPDWWLVDEDGGRVPRDQWPSRRTLRAGESVRGQVAGFCSPRHPEPVWLLINSEPMLDPATGEVTAAIVNFVDITEHRCAEQELLRREERYRSLWQSVPGGVLVVDRDDRIIEANRAACEVFGLPREAVVGRDGHDPVWQAIHEDGSPFPGDTHPSAITVRTGESVRGVVMGLSIHQDAAPRWILINSEPMLDPATGEVTAAIANFIDITERKRMDAALQRYRLLAESAHDLILFVDTHGCILDANEAAVQAYGYTREELLSLTVYDLRQSDPAELVTWQIAQAGDQGILFEAVHHCKDGRAIDVEVHSRSVDLDGQTVLLSIIRNITGRKRAEEQVARFHQQVRELSNELTLAEERERRRIATELHDNVSGALTAARLTLGMLSEAGVGGDLSRALTDVREQIREALAATRSLTLELSPPILYEFGFVAAVEWLAERMSRQYPISIRTAGLRAECPLPEDVKVLLFKVVRELLLNVIKHAQARTATVEVSQGEGRLVVAVRDDGVGFSTATLPVAAPDGGGFGLLSARERLRYVGGGFEVESRPGEGTTATLWVPLADAEA